MTELPSITTILPKFNKRPVFKPGRPWTLSDDNQFIRTFKGSQDIHVFQYKEEADVNAFERIRSGSIWSTMMLHPGCITSTPDPSLPFMHDKLIVHGVTIHGYQLKELADDLTVMDKTGQTFHLMVNRQGLCFLEIDNEVEGRVKRLRINDQFGWSKYGVRPQISTTWTIRDMNDGAVLMGPATTTTSDRGEEENRSEIFKSWKKLQEEKDKVMEKMESLLMKSLLLDEKKD